MSNNSSIYTLNSNYIPNSKCFGPDIIPCKGSCMYPKRKRAVAKFKQQFTPSDENLSTELKERETKLLPPHKDNITDFIKYNSRRYINNLDKWL